MKYQSSPVNKLFSNTRSALYGAGTIFVLLVLFSEYVVDLEQARAKETLRSYVVAQASTVRARLEGEMNSTLYLANGIAGYASAHIDLQERPANIVLSTVYGYGRHLKNVGIAPDNVLTYAYPVMGNEKVIGLRYEDLPKQWPAVKRAIDTASTILAGPVKLVQGGNGLISRTPVFLQDGKYWGIVSLVIDSDSLFDAVGLKVVDGDVTYALRGKDGLGMRGDMILGNQRLFDAWSVRHSIPVPGGTWELAAAPVAGWGAAGGHLLIFRLSGIAIAALISLLLYVVWNNSIHIHALSLRDYLTDLPNRRMLYDHLNKAVEQSQRSQQPFYLVSVDLDDFKPVNDRYGHSAGDEVLTVIAARMAAVLKGEDIVARIGGDEFIATLTEIHSVDQAKEVASRLLDAVRQPIHMGTHTVEVGASVGLSCFPQHGMDADSLLSSADRAMYQAKTLGKGQIFSDC